MHPDKKVGLALGILLIGITGAFFFRNESPDTQLSAPDLTDVERLDDRIRRKTSTPTPYLPDRKPDPAGSAAGVSSVPDAAAADVVPVVSEAGFGSNSLGSKPVPPVPGFHSAPAGPLSGGPDSTAGPVPVPAVPDPIRPGSAASGLPVPVPGATLTGPGGSVVAAGAASATGGSAAAAGPGRTSPAVRTYEVVPGDTLSGIAAKFLGSHRHFQKLFEANRDVLSSPDDLRPGVKLKIPALDAANGPSAAGAAVAPAADVPVPLPAGSSGPSFIAPKRAPRLPARRAEGSGGRPLSQTPPPDVPLVDGLDARGQAAVVAARDPDGSGRGGERSDEVPLPAAE